MIDQTSTAAEARVDASRDLAPGDQLAKYRLRRLLGAGAMGVVWAGYDPDLDREVAIKVLRDGDPDVAARTRLLREARAMARLKHPNVLTVYEVGTQDNRDYIVMELVDGGSLGDWLATRPPRREILVALLAAGRGLEAAHAAGVIHRDFKPHNVLRSTDGRVLVTDFGLAREAGAIVAAPVPLALDETVDATPHAAKPFVGGDSVLGSPLTGTGFMVGTPAYMAPELLGGAASDASSDQFAFCVTVWQALAGQRPFQADSIEGLQTAAIAGPAKLKAKLPSAIRAVLERGLDPNPARRWSDITHLLAALERTRRRRTVQVVVVLAVAAVALAIVAGMRWHATDQACTGADRALAQVWNDDVKARAHAAFVHTGLPFAAAAWTHSAQLLDGYGRNWIDMHRQTCEATNVRREQSAAAMDVRMRCLAQRLQQVEAIADVFVHADPQTVAKASDVTKGLAPLADCADVAALEARRRPFSDAAQRTSVDELQGRLARVAVLIDSGKYNDAIGIAEPALGAARTTGYEPVVADALLAVGRIQMRMRQDDRAEQTLEEAYFAAEATGDDRVAIRAAAELAQHVGDHLAREKDGMWWVRAGRALITRTGGAPRDEALLATSAGHVLAAHAHYDAALAELRRGLTGADDSAAIRIHAAIGSTLDAQGKPSEGLAEFRRALALAETTDGFDSPLVVTLHGDIGIALFHAGNYAEALAEQRRVRTSQEQRSAPAPTLAATDDAIGGNLVRLGKLDEALATYQRGLELRVKALGPDHVEVADSHINLGATLQQLGKLDEALVEYRRALVLQEAAHVPPLEAGTHNNIGVVLQSQHQYEAALAEYHRALALREQVLGPDHPDVAASHANIAAALQSEGRFKDALVELDQALAVQTKVLGADHPDTANTLAGLGEAYLALGDPHRAVDYLKRAIDIFERKSPDPEALGEFRFALAKALLGDHDDRAHAIELVRSAREAYRSVPGHAKVLAEIDAWLASHSS